MKNTKILFVIFLLIIFIALSWKINEDKLAQPLTSNVFPFTTNIERKKEIQELSIENIFDGVLNYDKNDDLKIAVLGDVMLGRTVNTQILKYKNNNWAFEPVRKKLKEYDLVFANLESPLIEDCKPTDTGMIFCGRAEYANTLKENGITAVSLANNHALNKGQSGLQETIQLLDDAGVIVTGVNNPTIINVKDIKIALLGFTDVECNPKYLECADEKNIVEDIEKAKKEKVDQIIIMFHWGSEYTYSPTLQQKKLAHVSIDNGADLILGNHPHWYQSVEIYKNKVIMYSHGNFVFDQMWSRQTREGLIGEYIISNLRVKDLEFIPVIIEDYGKVNLANKNDLKRILENLKNMSFYSK